LKAGIFFLALLTSGLTAFAGPPTLDSVFPAGGKRGSEIAITVQGKIDPWPAHFWSSEKGITITTDPAKKDTVIVKIAGDAPVGPVLLRAFSDEGVSNPILFIISDQNEVLEEEKDSSTLTAAMPLDRSKLPFVLNGTLSTGGELDSFRLSLEKGETIHAIVEAYGLRSLVDPVLHLYDTRGNRLQMEHDGSVNLDPTLHFTAPEKGDYLIALAGFSHPPAASVAYTGSKNAHYRLHLALKPDQLPARLLPKNPGADSKEDTITTGKKTVGTLKTRSTPNSYKITAKKDESLLIQVEGRTLGYPIDPVLRLLKADGTEIRKEDDTNKSPDPSYLWKVTADGEYQITISDRFGRAGEDMRYRVTVQPPVPDFTATVEKSSFLLDRKKALEVKINIVRTNGHKEKLVISLPGLPAGVTATAPEVPEKGGEVLLKLETKADAAPVSKGFRVIVTETADKKTREKPAVFSFTDDNFRGPYALDSVETIWLTLVPEKPAPVKPAPAKPAPAKPAPAKPAPAKPAPAKPVPAKPAPAKPAPAKPAPAKPAPAKPAPAKPVPAKPVPAKPVPAKPVPATPAPPEKK
jgi:hypothetical protein